MTSCQVWCRRTYSLPYYSVFAVNTLLYDVTLTFHPVTLTFDLWPLTLNIWSVSPVTWWNSVPNLNAIEQSAAELLLLQCLTLWPWTCFKCCAWLWDNFHQVWPSTTYPCLNYSRFWRWYVMPRCDLVDCNCFVFYVTGGSRQHIWVSGAKLLPHFLRDRGSELHQILRWHRTDMSALRVCFKFEIPCPTKV